MSKWKNKEHPLSTQRMKNFSLKVVLGKISWWEGYLNLGLIGVSYIESRDIELYRGRACCTET